MGELFRTHIDEARWQSPRVCNYFVAPNDESSAMVRRCAPRRSVSKLRSRSSELRERGETTTRDTTTSLSCSTPMLR